MSDTKKRGGRPRKGSLYWTKSGWRARLTVDIDGVSVQKSFDLETTDKQVARIKLRRLVKENRPPEELATEAARAETFEEAARRIVEEQRKGGMATWKERLHRLESHAFDSLGPMLPADIRAAHVRGCLESVRDAGKARQTMIHLKNDISSILGTLWRAEQLTENVCARVVVPEALPDATERTKKERAVLTDDELVRYLAWEHPEERHRMATLERQVMACVARMFGGLRTSDLHAVRWEGFDLTDGRFEWGTAPRRKGRRLAKGGKPQRLLVPEPLRPILADWWERAGRPTEGLIFPKRRPDLEETPREAARKRSSHAEAFRTDLRRAFGIDALVEVESRRSNGRKLTKRVWRTVREMTPRERELFEETEFTLPVDFHSWRRAFNQALADAGVNAQQAQALAGHSSLEAHERYLRNSQRMREIPAAALPKLLVAPGVSASLMQKPESGTPVFPARHSGFEPLTFGSGGQVQERIQQETSGSVSETAETEDAICLDPTGRCRNSMLKLSPIGNQQENREIAAWSRADADADLAAILASRAARLASRAVN